MTTGPLLSRFFVLFHFSFLSAAVKRFPTGRLLTMAGLGLLVVLLSSAPPKAVAVTAPGEAIGPAAPPKPIQIKDIVFNTGQNYGETVKKYPSTVYRRGEVFDISLAIEGEPIFLQLDIHGPAGYTTLFDRIMCTANADGFADCNQGTKSKNGFIEWLSWTQFRVVLRNPETKDVLIGNYKVIVHVVGADDSSHAVDSLIDFKKKFAVIFNPYDSKDEVYQPAENLREAYVYSNAPGAAAREESGVWYTAREYQDQNDGIWRTEGYQRLFVLRPFSPQIFDKMITVLDAEALKSAEEAYETLSAFVDGHLIADQKVEQFDVTELTTPGTRAQGASQANFLIAHLRSAGIPAIPIFVDANKWNKKNWNFHVWVEAWMNDRWLAADPFKGVNTPTKRKTLGAFGGPYGELNNDLIGVGKTKWSIHNVNKRVYRAIFDGLNPRLHGHPESFYATVDNTFVDWSNFYWPGGANPKPKLPIIQAGSPPTQAGNQSAGVQVEISTDQAGYEVGETLEISVTLSNLTGSAQTVPLTVQLEGDYLLTQSPVDSSMTLYNRSEIIPPQGQVVIPITASIPADARTDYSYQVTADTGAQTDTTPFDIAANFDLALQLPACFRHNQPFQVKAILSNSSGIAIEDVTLNLTLPDGFMMMEKIPLAMPDLEPGKTVATTFNVRPAAAGIGQFFVNATTSNGGAVESLVFMTSLCPVYLPVVINN